METTRQANVEITSLSVQSTTLDDVFMHYTGRQLRDALQEGARYDFGFMPPRR
jgi:ABC-2 type transport system ATP-binding protein